MLSGHYEIHTVEYCGSYLRLVEEQKSRIQMISLFTDNFCLDKTRPHT